MMAAQTPVYDAVIIGGGFYGCAIAIYLASRRGFTNILLVEREERLFQRASHNNQARVHNGYHYPRSFTTAFRSRMNLPRFVADYPQAVERNFTKLYAIARRNSKVTANQFVRFCREIGAVLEPATDIQKSWFEPKLIEDVFQAEEYAFNTTILAKMAENELHAHCVVLSFKTRVTGLKPNMTGDLLEVEIGDASGATERVHACYVFNCTYSGLNQFGSAFPGTTNKLKHELTEMALVEMPLELRKVGITVMDGPFFSAMPFPSHGLHSLSHVRYTPHIQWDDKNGTDPYQLLADYPRDSRIDRMLRDVSRYMPAISRVRYVESLFEVKTILVKNESDDGRPILFEQHATLPRCYSILGGKIDNIYDVLERLDTQPLVLD